jgi:hypothetical protein
VLYLARKIGSYGPYFFQRRQRQDRKNNHANPCQETKRCSKEAGAHLVQDWDFSEFDKADPASSLQHRYMQVEAITELSAGPGAADPRQIPCAA